MSALGPEKVPVTIVSAGKTDMPLAAQRHVGGQAPLTSGTSRAYGMQPKSTVANSERSIDLRESQEL